MEVADSDSSDVALDLSAPLCVATDESDEDLVDLSAIGHDTVSQACPLAEALDSDDGPLSLGGGESPDRRTSASCRKTSSASCRDGPLSVGGDESPDERSSASCRETSSGSCRPSLDVSPYGHVFHWAHRWLISLCVVVGERSLRSARRHWSVSSHFSGLGTVEVAISCMQVAARALGMPPLSASTAFACERDRGCQHVLKQRVGGACIFGDILELVNSPGVGFACSTNGRLNYEAACEMLENMPVSRAPCVSHKLSCQVPRPDLDISGSPCTPWSRMVGGTRLRRQHPLVATLVAWCRVIRALGVPLALHENVIGFDKDILSERLGQHYAIHEVRVSPSDVGFSFLRRPRVYYVLARRGVLAVKRNIAAVYAEVAKRANPHGFEPNGLVPSPAWVWQATAAQLLGAENLARQRNGMPPVQSPSQDWAYLLTSKQQAILAEQLRRWRRAHSADPASRPALVIDLSQRPAYCRVTETQLPTFRTSSSRIWSPSRRRWLLPVEQALAMGYPVTEEAASVMGLPVDVLAEARTAAAVGNAMHVANLGCILLSALACVEEV